MQKTSTRSIFLLATVSLAMVFGHANTNCSWFSNTAQPHKRLWHNFQMGISRTTQYNNENPVWVFAPLFGITLAMLATALCIERVEKREKRTLNYEEKIFEKSAKEEDKAAEELSEQTKVAISETGKIS